MPCPAGVDIPVNLELYSSTLVHEGSNRVLNTNLYRSMADGTRADACTGCGECEETCPQEIQISVLMPEVHRTFEG
jgi:hypothetical protein